MITSLQPYSLISGGGLVESNGPTFNAEEEQRFRRVEMVFNNLLLSRRELISRFTDRRRNIDEECGYPLPWTTHKVMQSQDWQDLHDYDPLAATINSLMAKECFQSKFEVYEDEDPNTYTEFEEAVDNLGRTLTDEPSHYAGDTLCMVSELLRRAWENAMIGRHGAILFGFDDVPPGQADGLRQPVKIAKYPGRKLLYARVFPEHLCYIAQKETDVLSPRYGKPLYYNMTLNDPQESQYTPVIVPGTATYNRQVHFSRILHICRGDGPDPYYHNPECQDVIKPISNINKVAGANAEGHYKGGFSTISIESANPDIQPNRGELKSLVEDWERSLTKMWALDGGLTAKTITPTIADPTPTIELNLKMIAMRKRIPKRKLEGSERGELASGQDDGDWNDQVKAFQYNVLGPRLVIPFFDRLINVGVLPTPKGSKPLTSLTPSRNGNAKLTKVQLGEPFRTRPGEIVSPVLANALPSPANKNGVSPNPSPANGKPSNGQPAPANDTLISPSSPRDDKTKKPGYYLYWPDISAQTDEQKANIASIVTNTLAVYAEKQVDQLIPAREFLVGVFRGLFTEDEVDMWLDAAEAARKAQETLAHKQSQVEIETQKKKIDEGVEEDPVKAAEEKRKAETEAFMNKIDQGEPPIGNAEWEWDGETYDLELDDPVPLTNAAKVQLTGGRWITTDEGHHIYLKGGVPVAGNPHVIAKIQGQDPDKPKKGQKKINIDEAHSKLKDMGYDLGKGKMDLKTGKTHYEVTTPGGTKTKMDADQLKNVIASKGPDQPKEVPTQSTHKPRKSLPTDKELENAKVEDLNIATAVHGAGGLKKVTVDGTPHFFKKAADSESNREVVTSELASMVGVDVPRSRIASVGGKKGVLSDWVDGTPGDKDRKKLQDAVAADHGGATKTALFGFLVGAEDRHGGNYVVKPDGRIATLDHADSVPSRRTPKEAADLLGQDDLLAAMEKSQGGKGVKFDKQAVKDLAAAAPAMADRLREKGMEDAAKGLEERGKILSKLSTIDTPTEQHLRDIVSKPSSTAPSNTASKPKAYKSGDEAEKDLAPSAKQWAEDPTKPLTNQALYGYVGTSDSFLINNCLRKKCNDKNLNKTADELSAVISKASFPKDVTTHRTINSKSETEKNAILEKFKNNVGKTIVDDAFVSTTANKEHADSWKDFAKERLGATDSLNVEVVVPKGSKAIYVPKDIATKQEWEVLIQRGSKFKVLSVEGSNIRIEVANG